MFFLDKDVTYFSYIDLVHSSILRVSASVFKNTKYPCVVTFWLFPFMKSCEKVKGVVVEILDVRSNLIIDSTTTPLKNSDS